jgi:ABC-type dipeptide/oligopeptide/nickel transport system permease subunit
MDQGQSLDKFPELVRKRYVLGSARNQTLAVVERDFVLAAQALGAANKRIIWQHLPPNSPLIASVNAVTAIRRSRERRPRS